ncbi:MAG: M23 family metallopeptidase [Clostridia bacterium]|nr:M23 family metallopeptidase [Clostridia bacterium]
MDISGIWHTEIVSVFDGEVVFAGVDKAFGNCVEIKHVVNGEIIYSFYAHLSEINVQEGQTVSQGQVIGLEGGDISDSNPGYSTGHHLHFEIRSDSGYGNDIDPNNYIKF